MKPIFLFLVSTFLAKSLNCQIEYLKYKLNLVIDFNSSLTISVPKNSSAIYWVLNQNETLLLEKTKRLPLFNVLKPTVRNSTIRSQFMCSPNDQECNQITIPKFGLNYLGTYSSQAFSSTGSDSLFDFNISAFINRVELACISDDCFYNQSSQKLSVLSGKRVSLECSVIIVQNTVYNPLVELEILSNNNVDCLGETQINQIDQTEAYSYLNISSNVNIILYKLSKKCEKTFSSNDLTFTCNLKSKIQSGPCLELNKVRVLNSLVSYVDIQYEPEMILTPNEQLNKILIAGKVGSEFFTCPFESNRSLQFEWKIKKILNEKINWSDEKDLFQTVNDFILAEKEFPISTNLEIGVYQFECRAKVNGLINKYSQVVTFNLNIIGK
ncbi:unnamed protein product [Brachionus calyciflorus]|uniref:Ig-like domain-containing protein n=1 Tax=Brachionus calyciflorus TaxID=104777 RepID=A0A814HVP0_9BILA|nr:unnamed protein product [Brachionus calyciflorus]